jgi:GT2 family glycosyltransferase
VQLDSSYEAGIINYHSYADLLRCIECLEAQSTPPTRIRVLDHDPNPDALLAARTKYPSVLWEAGPNRGYAGGANRLVALAAETANPSGFLLVLNPDVWLDPDFAKNLLAEMSQYPDAALGSGKLLRTGRARIDSAGIVMGRSRRLRDRGSGELDHGQYDRTERLFGVSGAAIMLRRSAIPALEIDGELFDEDFFVYHEETDLAWRAHLLGWSALYVPDATAVHDRSWVANGWSRMAPSVRRHSFANRYLEMIKNERASEFFRDIPAIAAWDALRIGHALLRDRRRLPSYRSMLRLAGRAWRKRQIIQRRALDAPKVAGGAKDQERLVRTT